MASHDPYDPRNSTRGHLAPRYRESVELSVEEIHRDFPPPGFRDVRRARSADPAPYRADTLYERESRSRQRKYANSVGCKEDKTDKGGLPKEEILVAVTGAVSGAALAVGGKWAYDRHKAKEAEREAIGTPGAGRTGPISRASPPRGRSQRRYSLSESDDDYDYPTRSSRSRERRSNTTPDPDTIDPTEEERRAKKMKGKQVLMTGLATIATIHAAHLAYRGAEARADRRKAVREGTISAEEAKKLQSRAIVQDMESFGIAVIAVKNAVGMYKQAKDIRQEREGLEEERRLRHQRGPQRTPRRPNAALRERYDHVYDSTEPYGTGYPYGSYVPDRPVENAGE